jgi:hypothetical protein
VGGPVDLLLRVRIGSPGIQFGPHPHRDNPAEYRLLVVLGRVLLRLDAAEPDVIAIERGEALGQALEELLFRRRIEELNPRSRTPLEAGTPVSFVPMSAVDEVFGEIVGAEDRPIEEVSRGYTPFTDGDVLFAKITPCMQNGKAAVARNLRNGVGFGSTEFHVLRPKPLELSEWLFHFVRCESFRKGAAANLTGTAGQQRVPAEFLANTVIGS